MIITVMSRLLLIVIILYAIWRIAGIWGRRIMRDGARAEDYSRFSARRRRRPQDADEGPRQLVSCTVCDTCVPEDRAVLGGDGEVFCSVRCRAEREPPPR